MSEPEDTRGRVLEVAGPLFAERGFDGVSVRDITDPARTSPAAVNYHFGGKERLYVEAVRDAAATCVAIVPVPDWPPGVPAEQRLSDFVRTMLRRLLHADIPAWKRTLIMREITQPRHGACEQLVRDFIRPTFEKLLGVLRDLVPAELPLERLRLLGASIVGQCLHYHHARHVMRLLAGGQDDVAQDIDRLTDHITAFSLAALRGMFPAPPPSRATLSEKGARR